MKIRALRNSVTACSLGLVLAVLTGVFVLFPDTIRAQASASINGTVKDSTGAVIPDATLVLHNRATNLDRTATTNDVGNYVFAEVAPGIYNIKVSKQGFTSVEQSNLQIVVNQPVTQDFILKTGAVEQTVTVEAHALTLETASSELGVAIVKQEVNDLPLNGRNFTQLLNLTPGISTINVSQNATATGGGGIWSNPIGTFSYPSVNGQTNRSNLFLLDGVNDEGSFGTTYAVPPIVDDIQEFKVQSHNDDASYGGVMGGIINVVTKSGTTSFHGSGWEFLRNTVFDARDPFLAKVTPFQQNQFGATFGGPVLIPGHINDKKTFFFLSYEGFRNHTTAQNLFNTPTATELGGDLSNGQASTPADQIYNPFSSTGTSNQPFFCDTSGNPLAASAQGIQAPVAGDVPCNKIPSSMLNQTMVNYANKLFPAPNLTGNPLFNGLDTTKTIIRQDEFNGRLDHQFSQHDNVWARWTEFRSPLTGSGGFTGLVHDQATDGYNVGVAYDHIFSPTSILELQFGRTNMNIDQGSNYVGVPGSFGTQVGFSPNFAGNFIGGISMIPDVVISGFIGNSDPSAHGAAQVDDTHVSDIWQWGGTFTKTYRQHTFSMGPNFAKNNANALYLNSSVIFTAANTQAVVPPVVNGLSEPGGSALASFLLGVPNSAGRRNVLETEHGGWVDGFFFMDQWRVTSKLTVNMGLRYDFTLMPIYGDSAHQNNFVGDMDFRNGTYILAGVPPSCTITNAAPCIPAPTAGVPFCNSLPCNVVPTSLNNGAIYRNDFTNWQPRVGFAYQVLPNTVVRAGFGMFYDNWAAIVQTAQNYEGSWPSVGQAQPSNLNPISVGPPTILAENPTGTGVLPGPTPFQNNSDWFADPYLKRPYAEQFNFGVQQQFGPSTVLTMNYVGSVGRRLDVGGAYNVASTPGPGPISDRQPFPDIEVVNWDRSVGRSSYNSLQVSLNGRSWHGLTYLVSYTWSKTLDLGCSGWYGVEGCSTQQPYNLNADKGPAAYDIPQNFTAAWVYQLPFGKGSKHSLGNGVLDYVVGGWALNGILSLRSGQPFDVGVAGDIANTGNFNYGNFCSCYERLNVQGNPYPSNQGPSQWLNLSAFSTPAPYTYGDLGRDSLRSDWYRDLDLSLFKIFPITESKSFEFRFETFNLTNTPVWAVPDANISDGARFGVVSSTANTARQLQFGLKFYF
jgi:Carboxypeptidase regulatory-like domain/TonB dependent receptor